MKVHLIELFGGPLDGFQIVCPLIPPPCFFLPADCRLGDTVNVYRFERISSCLKVTRLHYVFEGYQLVSPGEMARLCS